MELAGACMKACSFEILGSGVYRPTNEVRSTELDLKLGKRSGFVEGKSGVVSRRFAGPNDTTSNMAAKAAFMAIENAGWSKIGVGDIDCIISASGTTEQAIPCTAVLIQKELGLSSLMIPCFDINSTCLSFLSALDAAAAFMQVGRYNRILVVSSEIPSLGLNWDHFESSLIFGDGAAAFILEASKPGYANAATVIASHMETYGSEAHVCQVQAGGTRFHPSKDAGDLKQLAMFEMDGKRAFKVTSQKIDNFLESLFEQTDLTMKDIDIVVPHQASQLALNHIRKKLGIPKDRFLDIFADHGNQVAASIPTAMHRARSDGHFKAGNHALIIGTGAGISLSAMIFAFS
jgi:3-oxoacyl-[acyl-carrier-protein] synthase-3